MEESLGRFEPVCSAARDHGIRIRGYVSCVIACPYDGMQKPDHVAKVRASTFQIMNLRARAPIFPFEQRAYGIAGG